LQAIAGHVSAQEASQPLATPVAGQAAETPRTRGKPATTVQQRIEREVL